MSHSFKSDQYGVSLLGFLFVAGVLAVSGVLAAQVAPTVMEYQAILKAVQKASTGTSIAEVRSIFDKATSIDNIKSVSGKDLEVVKENDKMVVNFAYQSEIHLAGPAFLTLKYTGKSQ